MKQFATKFRLIFIPFLIISICTVCVYTALHWLFFIKVKSFPVEEEKLNLLGPMIFPWVPILIWLLPRVKLLNLKTQKGSPLMGYLMFAWIAMTIPTVIAQDLLITATGKLTRLDYMSEVNNLPVTKYYTVKHFYVNKRMVHVKPILSTSGKNNNDFNMTIYASVPIFDHIFPDTNRIAAIRNSVNVNALVILNGKLSTMQQLKKLPADSIQMMRFVNATLVMPTYGEAGKYGAIAVVTKGYNIKTPLMKFTPAAWLAIKYNKTISNHLSISEKQGLYRQFVAQSNNDFLHKPLDKFVYLDRVANSKELRNYYAAIKSIDNVEGDQAAILTGVNGSFDKHNGTKLPWIFGSLGIGSVIFLVTLLFKPLKNDEELTTNETDGHSSIWADVKLYFLPREGFYITPLIIDLNLIVFIIMVFAGLGFVSFSGGDLLKWGADFRPAIDKGEYWRLVTNMFLHGGVMHILFNMYGLLFVGIFLEPVIGTTKYIVAYFITGLAASLASVWWHPATVSVGASGAIFGMYGVFLALLTTNLFPSKFKKSFLISTSVFVGYNLLFGLTGGIDNAAHIGGLISGLLLGYIMYPTIKNQTGQKEAEIETQRLLDEFSEKKKDETVSS